MNMNYRPGQPNVEYTMCEFQDFSATQISFEINFGLYNIESEELGFRVIAV